MVELLGGPWGLAIAVFLAVALGTVSLALMWEWSREAGQKRAVGKQIRALAKEGFGGAAPAAAGIFRGAEAQAPWMQKLVTRVPQFKDLENLLEQARSSWSLQTFLILTVGLSLAFGLSFMMASGSLLFGALAAAFGASLPWLLVRRKRRHRIDKTEEQLPEAIDLLGRAIRAGHPLSAGIKMVGDEAPEPVAEPFRRAFEEQRFGMVFEDSMYGMIDRVPLVDFRILVTAILIQREVGGNLAEILDNISYTIRARFTIRRQLRVYTAQGRMSGYVLAVLPPTVGFVIYLLNGDYMLTLFRDPIGKFLLVSGLILQILGYLWIRKIVDVEY